MEASAPGSSPLSLRKDVLARVTSAASSMRLSPSDFISHLLRCFYSTLRGLPPHILFYIFSFLDYSTLSAVVGLTCRDWHDAIKKGERAKFFATLRQVHGVHVIDPVRGVLSMPRALKRALVTAAGTGEDGAVPAASREMAAPASSFLKVAIRTQDNRALPWAAVRRTVEHAVEAERLHYGEVHSPALQRSHDPVLAQAAVVTHDRNVYVFGGESYEGIVLDRCHVYDPMRRRWSGLPPLREARASACAAVFGSLVYVFGGYSGSGEVLDTYEVFDTTTYRWQSPVIVNGTRGFRMPAKACGLAAARFEDVLLLVGGCQSRLSPEDTAFTLSAVPSASATPTAGQGGVRSPGSPRTRRARARSGSELAESAAGTSPVTARAHHMSRDGPLSAETSVWVFDPRGHAWGVEGVPALPSPRAFGAVAVLALPSLGECLCYFGGCARADTQETAMLFVPLAQEPRGRTGVHADGLADMGGTKGQQPSDGGGAGVVSRRGSFLHEVADDDGEPGSAASTPRGRDRPRLDATLARYFRVDGANPGLMCDWQRYTRVPLGGAFTSLATLGTADSRTVVLSSFYPAPLIGYCKVRDLVPGIVGAHLAEAIAPRTVAGSERGSPTPSPEPRSPLPTTTTTSSAPTSPRPPLALPAPLDATVQQEAVTAAEQRRHQEREWSHHQRHELRRLMGAAVSAASRRRPLNPQTAGEERKWSLAPMPEIQVRDDHGRPLLDRVSWKTQSLNGKCIVGIE